MSDYPASNADLLIEHIVNCTPAKAAVVVDGSADDIVAGMVAAGWTLGGRVDRVAGKRIRFLTPPPDYDLTAEGAGPLLDPDCRDGKCGSCVGAPCEHYCHKRAGAGEGPAMTEEPCAQVRGMFECTRPLGHDGDHIAHDIGSQVVDRWPQEATP
jgi:hypothetical protein